jgi:hypothetical protein
MRTPEYSNIMNTLEESNPYRPWRLLLTWIVCILAVIFAYNECHRLNAPMIDDTEETTPNDYQEPSGMPEIPVVIAMAVAGMPATKKVIVALNWKRNTMYYSPTKGDWVTPDMVFANEACSEDDLANAKAVIVERKYSFDLDSVELIDEPEN